MLFKVFRRVCLLSRNIGQWRRKWEVDWTPEPQLQSRFKQFWKLFLNLWSRKWFNASRSPVINLIPLRLEQLKKRFGFVLINLSIIFLKIPKFSELRGLDLGCSIQWWGLKERTFLKVVLDVQKRNIASISWIIWGPFFRY